MKSKYIHWLQTDEGHFLTFGKKKAPWHNDIQIKVPRFIARLFNHII